MTNIFSYSHFITIFVQHYATNEPILPSFFIQNEMRNKITVNDLIDQAEKGGMVPLKGNL